MTIQQFIDREGLKMDLVRIPFRTDIDISGFDDNASHWQFRIYYPYQAGKEIKGHYSQGSAIKRNPTITDILNSMILDTVSVDQPFGGWCQDYGYDEDSRKALKMYRECEKEYVQLLKMFGSKITELYTLETL